MICSSTTGNGLEGGIRFVFIRSVSFAAISCPIQVLVKENRYSGLANCLSRAARTKGAVHGFPNTAPFGQHCEPCPKFRTQLAAKTQ